MDTLTQPPQIVIPGSPPPVDLDLNSFDFSTAGDPVAADQQAMELNRVLEERKLGLQQLQPLAESGEVDPTAIEEYQAQISQLETKFGEYRELKRQQRQPLFSFKQEVDARKRKLRQEALARDAVKTIQASDDSFLTMFESEEAAQEYQRRQAYMTNKDYLRKKYTVEKVLRQAGFSDREIEAGIAEPMFRQQIGASKNQPTVEAISKWGLDTINVIEKRKTLAEAAAKGATMDFLGVKGGLEEFEKAHANDYSRTSDEDRIMVRQIYTRQQQELKERYGKVLPVVSRIFNTIATEEGIEPIEGVEGYADYDEAIREFGKLTKPQFAKALFVMANMTEIRGQDVDGFMHKVIKNFGRSAEAFYRMSGAAQRISGAKMRLKIAEEVVSGERDQQVLAEIFDKDGKSLGFDVVLNYRSADIGRDSWEDILKNRRIPLSVEEIEAREKTPDGGYAKVITDPEEQKRALQGFKSQQQSEERASQIYNWRDTVAKVGSENWFVNDWVYGVARSLPEMGAAATGLPGLLLVASAQQERNMAEFRRTNPAKDWDNPNIKARAWAGATAYSLLNRVQFKTATAALPKTKAFISNLKNPLVKGAAGVLGFTGLLTAEAIQETGQDLTFPLAMNFYGGLDSDIKGFTLSKEIEKSIENFPRMMFAMVPFVVAGQLGRAALNHVEGQSFLDVVRNKDIMDRLNIDEQTQQDLLEMTPEELADFAQENAAEIFGVVEGDVELGSLDTPYVEAVDTGDAGSDNLRETLKQTAPEQRQAVVSDWLDRNPIAAEKLQEQVDEAAKKAGYDSPKVYRGHDEGQNVFATRLNTPTFTDSEGIADYYAENLPDNKDGKLTTAFLKMQNPLIFGEEGAVTKEELISLVGPELAETIGSGGEWKIDGEPGNYNEAGPEDYAEAYLFADNADFQEWAMQNGYDGFIYEGFFSEEPTPGKALGSYKDGFAKEWRPFNPSQIKSADPVTFDDDGNIIPLSRRFDTGQDIRGSLIKEDLPGATPPEFNAQIIPREDGTFTVTNGDNTLQTRSAEEAAAAVRQLDIEFDARVAEQGAKEAQKRPQPIDLDSDAQTGVNVQFELDPELESLTEDQLLQEKKIAEAEVEKLEIDLDKAFADDVDFDNYRGLRAAQQRLGQIEVEQIRREAADKYGPDVFMDLYRAVTSAGKPDTTAIQKQKGREIQALVDVLMQKMQSQEMTGQEIQDEFQAVYSESVRTAEKVSDEDLIKNFEAAFRKVQEWVEFIQDYEANVDQQAMAEGVIDIGGPVAPEFSAKIESYEVADYDRPIIDRQIDPNQPLEDQMVFYSFILPNLTGRPVGMAETDFAKRRRKQGLPPAVDPDTRAAVEQAARLRYGLRKLYFYKEAPGQLRRIGQEASRRIAGIEAQFNEIAKNIDIEVRRHVKKQGMNTQDAAFINFQTKIYHALRGDEKAMNSLPTKIRRSLTVARESIDAYSKELVESGMIDGDLATRVGDNLGSYVFREFKAFDSKYNWNYAFVKKQEPEIYEAALKEVMAGGLSQKDADLVLRGMLDPERGESFYGGTSKVGKISVTSLIKKKDLSPAILDYLGEITNPAVNVRNTGAKVSKMVITYHAQRHMAEQLALMGQGSWKRDEAKRHTAQIGQESYAYPTTDEDGEAAVGKGRRTEKPMEGFRGFYTDPELAAELEKYFNPQNGTTPFTVLGDALATVTGVGKFAQVILNPAAYPTNFFGGVFTEIFNGRVSFDAKGMRAYIKTGSFRNWGKEKDSAPYGVKEQQEFYSLTAKEFAAKGGVNSMRRSQLNTEMEMRGNRDNSVFANDINEGIESGLFGEKLSMASRILGKGYQAADNAAKRSAFVHEVDKWMKAEPDKTMDEILDLASADVRTTTQHYDMVAHFLKEFSQRGVVVPTYLSFGWELFRNTIGTARLASRELRSGNPVLRKYGMKRVAGMLAVAGAMHALTTTISQMFADLSDEDREKLRAELPPWLEGIEVAYLKADGKELVYFDPSYIIPHHVFYSAVMRAFKAETAEEKFEQSAKTILGPIAGQNVFFQAITEVNTNQKREGGEIYNEAIAAENSVYKLRQQMAHIGESVYTPGIVRSWRKYQKARDGEVGYGGSTASTDDLFLALLGIRPYRRDITSEEFVNGNISEFAYTAKDAKRFANEKAMKRAGKGEDADPETGLTPSQKRIVEESDRVQKRNVEKFRRAVEFLLKVGVSPTRIRKGFKDTKIPMYLRKEVVDLLSAGN